MQTPSTVAVVVTLDRPQDLDRLLSALNSQTIAVDATLVVDNGQRPETAAVLARHPGVVHLPSRRNLGGAGGFIHGIMHALALGADRVWIMDDDGYPETVSCLETLCAAMSRHSYDMVSPVIVDIKAPAKLAFYYYRSGRPLITREQIAALPCFPQFAHLFNGALIKAETFARYGLPRYELFFRGDETDFLFRLKRDGARFATIADAAFLHPSGETDALPIMGGRYHAIVPANPVTRYYYFRNRGNLFREFRLVRAVVYDLIRYTWAFGITRRGDWTGYVHWIRTVLSGFTRRLETSPLAHPRS